MCKIIFIYLLKMKFYNYYNIQIIIDINAGINIFGKNNFKQIETEFQIKRQKYSISQIIFATIILYKHFLDINSNNKLINDIINSYDIDAIIDITNYYNENDNNIILEQYIDKRTNFSVLEILNATVKSCIFLCIK